MNDETKFFSGETENQNLKVREKNGEEEKRDDTSDTKDVFSNNHQVIHKKEGRLHIYVRQDKYKGDLKSKNWVGRAYINGKQMVYSSGTPELEDAIPLLERWYDEKLQNSKKLGEIEQQNTETSSFAENNKKREISEAQIDNCLT